jgi:hypothetical protein
LSKSGDELKRFFFLDGQSQWLIRGPGHPECRTEHVEIKRFRRADGGAFYSKRFLTLADGSDYGYWTRRELRFVGNFGLDNVPRVVQPTQIHFKNISGGSKVEQVDTEDAGPTLYDWQRLVSCPVDQLGLRESPFTEAGELLRLLRSCLSALRTVHAMGIVHCDIKADNICLPYQGNPLDQSGIRLDYAGLRLIDFAFAVRPGYADWDLDEPLPIDPDNRHGDYFSPWFKRALHQDRGLKPPQAWRKLDYSVDLYALAVMLGKLLRLQTSTDPLHAALDALAREWLRQYADGAPAKTLPHPAYIQRIDALRQQYRPDWDGWEQSHGFVPLGLGATPAARTTPVAPVTPVAPRVPPPLPISSSPPTPATPKLWLRWLAMPVLVCGLAALIFWLYPKTFPSTPIVAAQPFSCVAGAIRLESLGVPLIGQQGRIDAAAFSPDGRFIASGGQDGGLLLWDIQASPPTGRRLGDGRQDVNVLAFSPDGRVVVSAGKNKGLHGLQRWDAQAGAALGGPLAGHENYLLAIAYARDGRSLVSGDSDGILRRWDAETGQPLGEPILGFSLRRLAFSPDTQVFATGGDDGTVGFYAIGTKKSIGEPVRGHGSLVNALVFSPDGAIVVSAAQDKTLRRWDAHSGLPLGEALTNPGQAIMALAYSRDGRLFASGDLKDGLRLWDAQSGCALAETRHPGGVSSLAFSPDGKSLVSGGYDKTLRRWRLAGSEAP